MRQIYFNGKVYTGALPLCEAFIVEEGLFTKFSGKPTTLVVGWIAKNI